MSGNKHERLRAAERARHEEREKQLLDALALANAMLSRIDYITEHGHVPPAGPWVSLFDLECDPVRVAARVEEHFENCL
jgi:hypothetical protein